MRFLDFRRRKPRPLRAPGERDRFTADELAAIATVPPRRVAPGVSGLEAEAANGVLLDHGPSWPSFRATMPMQDAD